MSATPTHLPVLILIGRPASGKSEIVDYLKKLDHTERMSRFHLGEPAILDDFPMLWAWFEEDSILQISLKKPRLHTDAEGYFKHPYFWNLLIERLNLEYQKQLRDRVEGSFEKSVILEFSRGAEHGGYQEAFLHLSDEILEQAAVIYVKVSYEESLRKNRRRFNPQKPDSILEHSLPDRKLERLYKEDDWEKFSRGDAHFLQICGHQVPYAVFENDDDITTENPDGLAVRLEETLQKVSRLRSNNHPDWTASTDGTLDEG